MTRDIINSIILAGLFLSLFGIAELLYHKAKMAANNTRKIVHLGTGLLSMLFPVMLQSQWFVLLLCVSFGIILLLTMRFNLLKSIHAIDRISYGSLLYPVAVYGSFIAYTHFNYNYLYFYLPVLTMAICDPIAATFGKKWPHGKFHVMGDGKTAIGCFAFFTGAILLTVGLLSFLPHPAYTVTTCLVLTVLIAMLSTLTEAISVKGLDNLTIPISVLLVLTLLHV